MAAAAHQAGDYEDEDAWDLADDDEGGAGKDSASLDLHREWRSRHTHFHTLGYRDGIEEGKKSSVQQGFNAGYSQGIEAGRVCGLARGWAGAFTALPPLIQSLLLDDTSRMHVNEVQADLSCLSSEKAAYLYYDSINKLDGNATNTVAEDLMKEDTKVSNDTTVSVEKFHAKLQSILRSSGILP